MPLWLLLAKENSRFLLRDVKYLSSDNENHTIPLYKELLPDAAGHVRVYRKFHKYRNSPPGYRGLCPGF